MMKRMLTAASWWGMVTAMALAVSGCASGAGRAMIDADVAAFEAGVNSVLRVGMTIREARAALLQRFPSPSFDSEVSPAVPNANRSRQTRRYMMGWPTTTPGTTLVVTLFSDRANGVVRWTMGPLTEGQ